MNESLPNITGTAAGNRTPFAWSFCYGAFYRALDTNVPPTEYGAGLDSGRSGISSTLGINASRSSSVYQDNAKVRPDTCKTNIVIKY